MPDSPIPARVPSSAPSHEPWADLEPLIATSRAAEMLAALADPVRLRLLAELAHRGDTGATLGDLSAATGLPMKTVGAAVARLAAVGAAMRTGETYTARLYELRDVAAAVDAANPVNALLAEFPRLQGVFSHGRLVSPPDVAKYGRDLADLAARAAAIDRPVDEAEVNRRLSHFCDDVAFMRRLMVDMGVLARDPSGATYGPPPARPV